MNVDSGQTRKPRRIGDEERNACVEQLAVHHARGRLGQDDFEERLGLALTAQTGGELGRLLVDLPLLESVPTGKPARADERTDTGLVTALGVLVLVLTWVMVMVLIANSEDNAALAVAIANVASLVGFFLLMSGTRARRRQRS